MIITRVDTGDKTEYLFRLRSRVGNSGEIDIETCKRGADDRDANFYHDLHGKGTTAVRRLAESHAQLRKFFDAAKVLSVYDVHGRFIRFIEPDEADDDDTSAALETVTEIMEEIADFEGLAE